MSDAERPQTPPGAQDASPGLPTRSTFRVDGYEIERQIGAGGMGVVFAARRVADGARVAIKVLASMAREQVIERFIQEAKIGRRLNHPDIVKVLDAGREPGPTPDTGRPWIVMEFLEGYELTAAARDPSFGFEERLAVMVRVARALHHAHEAGVIHRDVKPANIYLTREGGVRLLDFGVSKLPDVHLTRTGQLNGTPRYLAPEQIKGLEVDRRVDVFALGLVTYELFSNDAPWQFEDLHSYFTAVSLYPPRPFNEAYDELGTISMNEAVLAELHEAIHSAIEPERNLRCRTAEDFARALERVVAVSLSPDPEQHRASVVTHDRWADRRLEWAGAQAAWLMSNRGDPVHFDSSRAHADTSTFDAHLNAASLEPVQAPVLAVPEGSPATRLGDHEADRALFVWTLMLAVLAIGLGVIIYIAMQGP